MCWEKEIFFKGPSSPTLEIVIPVCVPTFKKWICVFTIHLYHSLNFPEYSEFKFNLFLAKLPSASVSLHSSLMDNSQTCIYPIQMVYVILRVPLRCVWDIKVVAETGFERMLVSEDLTGRVYYLNLERIYQTFIFVFTLSGVAVRLDYRINWGSHC